MTRYSPIPGTGRCKLCAQMDDGAHKHPWPDVLIWLWKSSASWKIIITVVMVFLVVMLASLFALLRADLVEAL